MDALQSGAPHSTLDSPHMIVVSIWLAIGASLLVAIVSFIYLVRHRSVTLPDVALFIAPFVLWYALVISGLRPKSMSNLVEPLALLPILSCAFGIRTFVARQRSSHRRACAALVVGLVSAVLVYAIVPILPE